MAATSSKKVFELFVSKVPWTICTKEMKEYFGQFGNVRRCVFPMDSETGFHRGFCWVSFMSEESLNNALHKEPHVLEGAKLQVQKNVRNLANRSQKKSEAGDE